MIVETTELQRHYQMLERLPQQRLAAEGVMNAYFAGVEVPHTMVESAGAEAHLADTMLPILIQRARGLGEVALFDTLTTQRQMVEALHRVKDING